MRATWGGAVWEALTPALARVMENCRSGSAGLPAKESLRADKMIRRVSQVELALTKLNWWSAQW